MGVPLGTAALRRLKKRRQRERSQKGQTESNASLVSKQPIIADDESVIIIENDAEIPEEFQEIFKRFAFAPQKDSTDEMNPDANTPAAHHAVTLEVDSDDFEMPDFRDAIERASGLLHDAEQEEHRQVTSRKQMKRVTRMSLAELKAHARRPEVVEWEDVTARDPLLLVHLKAVRGSVPVPAHWSRKRRYLAGKRGFVKPPFELPAFIRDTGITEIREAARKADAGKTLQVKARERMRPKMPAASLIDYQRLYDAFFRFQTKPSLTIQGDLYYEGREFESRHRDKRPGFLSAEAREALGMGTSNSMPPQDKCMDAFA